MKHISEIIKEAKPIRGSDLVMKASNIGGDLLIKYKDQPDFERIARQFGIFEEWKVIPSLSFSEPLMDFL